jgi:hypothetical protein
MNFRLVREWIEELKQIMEQLENIIITERRSKET